MGCGNHSSAGGANVVVVVLLLMPVLSCPVHLYREGVRLLDGHTHATQEGSLTAQLPRSIITVMGLLLQIQAGEPSLLYASCPPAPQSHDLCPSAPQVQAGPRRQSGQDCGGSVGFAPSHLGRLGPSLFVSALN